MRRMASGAKAGLQDARAVEAQLAAARHEGSAPSAAAQGAGAATVYRDRRGRRLDMLSDYMRTQERAAGADADAEALRYQWGRGAADKARDMAAAAELDGLRGTAFAVHADDADLNADLRQRLRADDPMAAAVAALRERDDLAAGPGSAAARHPQSRGRRIYRGPPGPPNRFGVAPGYRWDGVDRSNGYEARFQSRAAHRAHRVNAQYATMTSDM